MTLLYHTGTLLPCAGKQRIERKVLVNEIHQLHTQVKLSNLDRIALSAVYYDHLQLEAPDQLIRRPI